MAAKTPKEHAAETRAGREGTAASRIQVNIYFTNGIYLTISTEITARTKLSFAAFLPELCAPVVQQTAAFVAVVYCHLRSLLHGPSHDSLSRWAVLFWQWNRVVYLDFYLLVVILLARVNQPRPSNQFLV